MEKNDKQIVDLYLATQSNLSAKTETNRSILKYLDGNLGEGERIALVQMGGAFSLEDVYSNSKQHFAFSDVQLKSVSLFRVG